MNTGEGPLSFDATINDTEFDNAVNHIQNKIKGLSSTTAKEGERIKNIFGSIAVGMAGAFTLDQALQFRKQLISVRGEFQKYEAVLANSLNSQEDAAESMEMLTYVASKTPFQLDSLTNAYVKLVNQGFKPSQKEIIKLGDLASSTGKDFNQLAEAIIDAQTGEFERLKDFGIKAKVSGDQVSFSFKEVTTTVKNSSDAIRDYMLSLGDMKGVKGASDAISKTLVGQMSNLEDSITAMFNKIGQNSEGFLSDSISATKYLVDNYAEIGRIIGLLITTYGAYKAAVITITAIERARSSVMIYDIATKKAVVTMDTLLTMSTNKLAAAQAFLNKTILSNPYALVVAALAAIIYAMSAYNNKLTEAERLQNRHNEIKEKYNKTLEEEQAKTESLIMTAKNENVSKQQRKKALDELITSSDGYLSKLSLENISTAEGTKLLNSYNNEFERKILLQANEDEKIQLIKEKREKEKKKLELDKQINDLKKNTSNPMLASGGVVPSSSYDNVNNAIEQSLNQRTKLLEEQTAINAQLIALQKEEISLTTTKTTTKTETKSGGDNNKLKELKTDYSELADEIERLEAEAERKGERMSELFIDKLTSDAEAEYDRWEKHKNLIATVITETKTLNQKLFDINQEYSEKEAALRESSNGIDLDDRLSILKEQKQKEIDIALDEAAKRTEIYKEITKTVISEGETELKNRLSNIRTMLQSDKLSAGMRLELMKLLAETEQKLIQNTTDKKKKSIEELAQSYNDIANSLSNVADSVSLIDENMGKIIGQAGQFAGQLGSSIKQLTEATSTEGKVAGFSGIVNTLFQVADLLDKQFGEQKRIADLEKERADYNKSLEITLEEINYQLERQLELLDSMPNEIKLLKSIDEYVKSIKRANAELSKMQFDFAAAPKGVDATITIDSIKYITKEKDAYLALSKALKDGLISQEDYDIAISYLEAIKTGTSELEQLKKEYEEYITGTSVQSLVDEIAQMFQQGKISAADFANNFKQLMTNAMLQSLKMKMLEPALTAWFNNFSGYLQSNGGLSQYEITALAEQYETIFGTASVAWEEMMKIIGGFGTNATGPDTQLTGAIKGVSEETASVIAGQMNAIRINQAEMLDINRDSLMYLSNIDRHTNELHHMRRTLDRMAGDVSKNSNSQNNSML